MERIMKIQTKMVALLLTLPMAYAAVQEAALSGVIEDVNQIANMTTPVSNIIEGGAFNGNSILTGLISNNNPAGWELVMYSSNGGHFQNESETDSVLDGNQLKYTVSCDSTTHADATSGLTLPFDSSAPITVLTASSPTSATDEDSLACHLSLADGETVSELYNGTYSDTFYVELKDITT